MLTKIKIKLALEYRRIPSLPPSLPHVFSPFLPSFFSFFLLLCLPPCLFVKPIYNTWACYHSFLIYLICIFNKATEKRLCYFQHSGLLLLSQTHHRDLPMKLHHAFYYDVTHFIVLEQPQVVLMYFVAVLNNILLGLYGPIYVQMTVLTWISIMGLMSNDTDDMDIHHGPAE